MVAQRQVLAKIVPASAVTGARAGDGFAWGTAGLLAAAILGIGTALDAKLGLVIALGLTLALAVVLRYKVILPLLAASIIVEDLSIGGITVSRLLAPLALGVLIAVAMRRDLRIGATSPLVWVGAYCLWALASVAWTISPGDTRFELASLTIALVYLAVVATLIESRRDLRRVLFAIAAASLLAGLVAIATVVLGISSQLQAGRPNGGAGDPNYFAAYQVVAFPLTLALAISSNRRSTRVLFLGIALVDVASIFASESRGGLLALTSVVLLIVLLPARMLFLSREQKATFLIVVLLAGGVALTATGAPLLGRIQSVDDTDPTGSGRIYLWKGAWTSTRERPILGVGYGSFPAAVPDLLRETQGIDFRHIELHPDKKASEAHSAYVGTLAELGIPGLALFVLILLGTAGQLVRISRRARNAKDEFVARIATALLLSLVGWSVASIFLSTESSRSLWLLIGVVLALPKVIRRSPSDNAPRPTPATVRASSW
ncbi:MAG: O-antigen ligase family protein [Gaiellales bacterium]